MIDPRLRHNVFHIPDNVNFRDAAVAIIIMDDGRYLMQLRDNKPGIFFPDYWGLFGGAMDPGEDAETALRRELREELDHEPSAMNYFTKIEFYFDSLGASRCSRIFYEVPMRCDTLAQLRLGEGQSMQPIEIADLLLDKRVVPYDSFAIWMHYARDQRVQTTRASRVS